MNIDTELNKKILSLALSRVGMESVVGYLTSDNPQLIELTGNEAEVRQHFDWLQTNRYANLLEEITPPDSPPRTHLVLTRSGWKAARFQTQ